MKKVVGFSVALAAVLFAACDNKENSYNFAQIIYPSGYGSVLYADQTVDSLRFATTYDWSLSVSEGWIHVDADSMSGTVPQGYFMVKRLNVDLDVNNTDTVRTGYIYFHADGKTLVTSYTQYHYLNIERPVRRNYQFTLQDTARQVTTGRWLSREKRLRGCVWPTGLPLPGVPENILCITNWTRTRRQPNVRPYWN